MIKDFEKVECTIISIEPSEKFKDQLIVTTDTNFKQLDEDTGKELEKNYFHIKEGRLKILLKNKFALYRDTQEEISTMIVPRNIMASIFRDCKVNLHRKLVHEGEARIGEEGGVYDRDMIVTADFDIIDPADDDKKRKRIEKLVDKYEKQTANFFA